MLAERGISVDHTTIYRWVQCYAPEMEKRLRWFWRRGFDPSWRPDETYVKVRGKVDLPVPGSRQAGRHDRFLPVADPQRQGSEAVLGKALRGLKHWKSLPRSIPTKRRAMVQRSPN